jgi:predicted TPR repeat methyltransferase
MSADTGTNVSSFLQSIHTVSSPDDCRAIYDEWAKTYDIDVRHAGVDYVGPTMTAHAVVAADGNITGAILDAGCGTGLVGVALSQAGAKNIDGIDISPGMLEVARKTGVYNDLSIVDMSKVIEKQDQSYDVITCVGIFTEGHVGPVPALQELVRVVKKDGLVVSTAVDDVWVSGGYEAEVLRLGAVGAVDILSTMSVDYRRGTASRARMVILKRR